MDKQCTKCLKTKLSTDFHKRSNVKSGLSSACKECMNLHFKHLYNENFSRRASIAESNKSIRKSNIEKFVEFIRTSSCVDCGENDPVVLELDHVRGEKRAAVSDMVKGCYKWDTIKTEIDKCEVRCANCHRRKTFKQFGWKKYFPL